MKTAMLMVAVWLAAVLTPAWAQIDMLAADGRYAQAIAQAEPMLQQARAAAAAAGEDGTQVALLKALAGSAQLYWLAGNHERALDLYSQALALYGKAQPSDAQPMLRLLPPLLPTFAQLAARLGRHELAVQALVPLLAFPGIDQQSLWPLRLELHSRLGSAALRAGHIVQAEQELTLALQERQAVVGVMLDTPIPVAAGQQMRGDLTALRNVQQRMMETIGAMGRNHQAARSDGRPARDYAVRLGWLEADTPAANLARLYGMPGRTGQLLPFYQGAFARYAHAMQQAPQQEGYVELEMEYAMFGASLSAAGHWQAAHEAILEALRLNALRLPAALAYLTPDYASEAFATRRELVHLLLSHQLAAGAALQDWRAVAGELMQSKALGNRLQARRAAALRHSDNPAAASLQAAMNALDPNASLAEYYQQWHLDTQLQQLLAPMMAPVSLSPGARLLAQVQQGLGEQTLLVLSVFQPVDFATMMRLPARYVGQRVSADSLALHDLGEAAVIEAELAQWRRELQAPSGNGDMAPAGSARLYQRLLQPLLGVRAADASYVALPEGALAQLPLEALVDQSGQYLLARGAWRYLSSVEPLLASSARPSARPSASAAGAVVFGAPDFDARLPGASAHAKGVLRPALQQLRFSPLPGAAAEAEAVASLLRGAGQQVTLYTGKRASVAQLRALHRPRLLHLATHGFFLGELAGGSEEVTGRDGNRYLHDLQVPHFNSGLALAGANSEARSVLSPGLAFSFQLRQLDLEGTELVVLSACESGAGTVVAGDTVDSLRQSLEAAGARSTITTLWQVSDAASAELMQQFYRRLAGGMDKAEALRQAKLALAQRWRQPFYWAPYILAGAG